MTSSAAPPSIASTSPCGNSRRPEITAARPPVFHNLRELGLFHCIIRDKDFDTLLAHCPKLQVLSIVLSYGCPTRHRLVSGTLRIAVEWMCGLDEVVVEEAPCLERLLFHSDGKQRPVKIVRAPRLQVLGFLDLNIHKLEIGGIAITAEMNVRARAMVPSLKILGMQVQFTCNEAKMLPTLLKCFPHLETLHIMPVPFQSPEIVHDLEFWESLATCKCLHSHLKTVVVHGYAMENHGIDFGKYISGVGMVLESMLVCSDNGTNLRSFSAGENNGASGGWRSDVNCAVTRVWSFENAIDVSLDDPFCVYQEAAY